MHGYNIGLKRELNSPSLGEVFSAVVKGEHIESRTLSFYVVCV